MVRTFSAHVEIQTVSPCLTGYKKPPPNCQMAISSFANVHDSYALWVHKSDTFRMLNLSLRYVNFGAPYNLDWINWNPFLFIWSFCRSTQVKKKDRNSEVPQCSLLCIYLRAFNPSRPRGIFTDQVSKFYSKNSLNLAFFLSFLKMFPQQEWGVSIYFWPTLLA